DAAAADIAAVREAAAGAGRDPDSLRIVLRIVESEGRAAEVARHLPGLARAGVQEVIVDLDWETGDHREAHDAMEHAIR
ncbi:MAG TPA: hypothetical protein VNZ62_03855, partial [Capillimicrobium sp.]|nr:hypothetical protein [Capillimicrobium sp.]